MSELLKINAKLIQINRILEKLTVIKTTMEKLDFEKLIEEKGTTLKALFSSLALTQQAFIRYCSLNGTIHYCQSERFSDEEKLMSDQYKIKTIMKKVLAIEYDENISLACLPGSTNTFHAIISLPNHLDGDDEDDVSAKDLIEDINEIKTKILNELSGLTDLRVKLNGEWHPVKKELLKRIGKGRCNLKQVNRKVNFHDNVYQSIMLSGTRIKPIYKKSKTTLTELLKRLDTERAKLDLEILKTVGEEELFPCFYEEYYDAVQGNFKYTESSVIDDKKYLTQKISSPVFIIHEFNEKVNIKCGFKNKKSKQSKVKTKLREDKKEISEEKFLYSLPVYRYI